jgi:hypothetical protein
MNKEIQQIKPVWEILLIAENKRSCQYKKHPKQDMDHRSLIHYLVDCFDQTHLNGCVKIPFAGTK